MMAKNMMASPKRRAVLDLLDLLGDPMAILLRQSFHGLQVLLDLLGDLLRDRVPDQDAYRVRHFADV